MQTALHILSLVKELQDNTIGARIVSSEFYKKERSAYLFFKGKKHRLALGFVYHPHGAGVFLVPASKVTITTREKPWPVFNLQDAVVDSVEQKGLDRIFTMTVKKDKDMSVIVFEALGQNGNMWLLDRKHKIVATLRKRDFETGQIYTPPPSPVGIIPYELTVKHLQHLLAENTGLPFIRILEKNLLGFNHTLAKELVHRVGDVIEPPAPEQQERIVRVVHDIVSRFRTAESGYLYHIRNRLEAYPMKLTHINEQPEKFKSLSLAVQHLCSTRQNQVEQESEQKKILQAIRQAIKRLERRVRNIEQDIVQAEDYEQYKKIAELLQIHFDKIKRGANELTVENVYSDNHETITIKLDPALTPAENIEVYAKRYRKGREGLSLLKRRLEISKQELESLQQIGQELHEHFEAARQRYETELASLVPQETVREEIPARLPFRRFTLSSGLTILVGRDGTDNDRTTFEFTKPYELWFHTQQCPGSHVVIKYPSKTFQPSAQEIAETASIAAWFSKARNDGLVPVIYTQRKYVRKPRKAKPGLVTVEREKSIMVVPRKPDQ